MNLRTMNHLRNAKYELICRQAMAAVWPVPAKSEADANLMGICIPKNIDRFEVPRAATV